MSKKNEEILKRLMSRAYGLIKMESAGGGVRLDGLREEALVMTDRMIKYLEYLEKYDQDALEELERTGERVGFDFVGYLRGALKRRNAILYRNRARSEAIDALFSAKEKNRPEKELKELRKDVDKHTSEFLLEAFKIETEFSQIRVIAGEDMPVPEKPKSGRPPNANRYTREEDNF